MKDLNELNEFRVNNPRLRDFVIDKKTQGYFEFEFKGDSWFVIATVGLGWQHVSISGVNGQMPNWDIMEWLKNKFFNPDEFSVEFHPLKKDYVNNMSNCLHMWLPIEENMPYPDMKQLQKSKPEIVAKKVLRLEDGIYSYTHSKYDDFELLNIKSAFNRRPSWDVVCQIKQEVFGDSVAISYHGIKGDKLSKISKENPDSILVWRLTKEKFPTPPSYLIGVKGVTYDELKCMTEEEMLKLIVDEMEIEM